MSGTLEIVSSGAWASVQDFGRFGFRRIGVPCSGVLDRRLMRIANRLVGNADAAPVIECFDGGQQFAAAGTPLRIAVAGPAVLELEGEATDRRPAAWRSFTLEPGHTLRLPRIAPGRIAIVAVAGLRIPQVLHSASTFARATLGGWHGRALTAGDSLPADAAPDEPDRVLSPPPQPGRGPVRVVPGPQADHFDAASFALFLSADYRVSAAADRMGMRLEGPALAHRRGHEIVSDATVPGAIQVPGNGQPIVLLNDAQTAGGYPKIATVISVDLPRLAATRPGELLRFEPIDAAAAGQLARDAERATLALLDSIRPLAREGADLAALYTVNLIGGTVDARAPDAPPADAPPETSPDT